MPALSNAKHEVFAQEVFKGGSARSAYVKAGYAVKSDRVADANASRLLTDAKVAARIAELQGMAVDRALLTLEEHMQELASLRDMAKANNQTSAAVSAEVKRGELMGYYIERRENTNRNFVIADKPMSQDEWEQQYCLAAPSGASTSSH